MLVLALRAAKYSTWSACDKGFGTMPAKLNRIFAVGQHKAEHHLNSKHERVKIPNNRRLIQKSHMIGWSDAAKSCHALLHHLPGFIVQCIIILIIKETVDIGKRPVNELLFHPFISLRIFSLKAHVDRHRLGNVDTIGIDTVGDGMVDTVLMDTDLNGIPDTIFADTTGDGKMDTIVTSGSAVEDAEAGLATVVATAVAVDAATEMIADQITQDLEAELKAAAKAEKKAAKKAR